MKPAFIVEIFMVALLVFVMNGFAFVWSEGNACFGVLELIAAVVIVVMAKKGMRS